MFIVSQLQQNFSYFFRNEAFSPIWDLDYNKEIAVQSYPLESIDSEKDGVKKTDFKIYSSGMHNWVYRDGFIVNVYNNGMLVDPSNYRVNYLDGNIIFSNVYAANLSEYHIIAADFTYQFVNITDDYPEKIQNAESNYRLPLLSIEGLPFSDAPLELGNAVGKFRRQYLFHILGNNDVERDELLFIVNSHFRREIPLIDYAIGFPLNDDGSKNESFTPITVGQINIVSKSSYPVQDPKNIQITNHWGVINTTVEVNY